MKNRPRLRRPNSRSPTAGPADLEGVLAAAPGPGLRGVWVKWSRAVIARPRDSGSQARRSDYFNKPINSFPHSPRPGSRSLAEGDISCAQTPLPAPSACQTALDSIRPMVYRQDRGEKGHAPAAAPNRNRTKQDSELRLTAPEHDG